MAIIKALRFLIIFAAASSLGAHAQTRATHKNHSNGLYYHLVLQAERGWSKNSTPSDQWEIEGRIGSDERSIVFELDNRGGDLTQSEVWGLVNMTAPDSFDYQVGLVSIGQSNQTAIGAGVSGHMPYGFETKAHFVVTKEGHYGLRIKQENALYLNDNWLIKPYWEARIAPKPLWSDDQTNSDIELGLRFQRRFGRHNALWVGIERGQSFGVTDTEGEWSSLLGWRWVP